VEAEEYRTFRAEPVSYNLLEEFYSGREEGGNGPFLSLLDWKRYESDKFSWDNGIFLPIGRIPSPKTVVHGLGFDGVPVALLEVRHR
jgi:hypothetical protein